MVIIVCHSERLFSFKGQYNRYKLKKGLGRRREAKAESRQIRMNWKTQVEADKITHLINFYYHKTFQNVPDLQRKLQHDQGVHLYSANEYFLALRKRESNAPSANLAASDFVANRFILIFSVETAYSAASGRYGAVHRVDFDIG